MIIVKVVFVDWNGNKRDCLVSSEVCEGLRKAGTEEDAFLVAIRYVKRRWTEWASICSCELIAR